MKIEDIENAAREESGIWAPGPVHLQDIYRRDDFEDGFHRGAEWRINRVWHFDKSAPNPNEPFLFIFHKGVTVLQISSEEDWNKLVKDLISVKWAYIKDLIPMED